MIIQKVGFSLWAVKLVVDMIQQKGKAYKLLVATFLADIFWFPPHLQHFFFFF